MEIEVDQLTKNEAGQLRKALRAAAAASDNAWWKRAKLLHAVYYSGVGDELKPVYELWGFETWFDYVESEVGMHVGTANIDVTTAHFFLTKMKGAFSERNHLMSRQRMRALARRPQKVTKEKLNFWVSQARNSTVCQLEHKLDDGKRHTKRMSLDLSQSEYDLINQALSDLMSTGGYKKRGEALVALVSPKRLKTA